MCVEKDDICALDFTLAVAPVKIRVGGRVVVVLLLLLLGGGLVGWTWERRRGREYWEKRKAPFLETRAKRGGLVGLLRFR